MIHTPGGHGFTDWKIDEILSVSHELYSLPEKVRQRVAAALYWLRSNPDLILQENGVQAFRSYTDRWNAFECLVEAVREIRPEPQVSRSKKQQTIDTYMAQQSGPLSAENINYLYSNVVNPGFVGKAKYALQVCFENDSDDYIYEFFDRADRHNRLHDIRNAINHGDIDAEMPNEVMRIQSRLHLLHMMLLQMFGRIVRYSCPANEGFTRHVVRSREADSGCHHR